MCPPAATPILDISEHCTDEELFMSLEKLVCGGPLPRNVTCDVNPHHYKPENLPVGLWYLIILQNRIAVESGAWKAIGEPHRIFSNDSICGWRTTYIFRDQQPSNNSTADWLMQEYMITQNGIDYKTVGKDASALCRVFQNCPSLIKQDLQKGPGLTETSLGTPGNSTNLRDLHSLTRGGEASTSNRQVNNIVEAVSVARNNLPDQENVPDADWEVLRGDFIEIDDLHDIPQFPSSSSGNSSCLTMSSNECFDSLGLFQDIENEIIQDLKKKGADHKFNVASVKPDRIVTCALSPGSSTARINEEIQTTRIMIASSSSPSTTSDIPASQALPKQEIIEKRQNPGSNPPVCSHPMPAALASKTGKNADAAARWKKSRGGAKMLKKLCFMPF